jgi:hypothetical protein
MMAEATMTDMADERPVARPEMATEAKEATMEVGLMRTCVERVGLATSDAAIMCDMAANVAVSRCDVANNEAARGLNKGPSKPEKVVADTGEVTMEVGMVVTMGPRHGPANGDVASEGYDVAVEWSVPSQEMPMVKAGEMKLEVMKGVGLVVKFLDSTDGPGSETPALEVCTAAMLDAAYPILAVALTVVDFNVDHHGSEGGGNLI